MQSLDSLQGGSTLREQAALQSLILNALLPNSQRHPQTFCAASSSQLETYRPWTKAFTLKEVSEASKKPFEDDGYITSEEIMAILFQLIWTLAVLQKEFPGYQHNFLASNVRLYTYGGVRCYRISGGSGSYGGTSYYVRKFMPLPVIINWKTSNCSQRGIDIPYRTEPDEPGKDLNDVLNALFYSINTNLPPKEFRLALKLQDECTRYYIKVRRRDAQPGELLLRDQEEVYLDKRETGENICVPFILGLQCPPGYTSLNSPSGQMAMCGKCTSINGEPVQFVKRDVRGVSTLVCSNGEAVQKTSENYSTYFNDFLEPLQFREQALAVVNGF